jgi:hypothetical protein
MRGVRDKLQDIREKLRLACSQMNLAPNTFAAAREGLAGAVPRIVGLLRGKGKPAEWYSGQGLGGNPHTHRASSTQEGVELHGVRCDVGSDATTLDPGDVALPLDPGAITTL